MKSSKETNMKLNQKTILLCIGAVAVVALVTGTILMITKAVNNKNNPAMNPAETQMTQGTDVFGNAVDSYVGDVGKITYDMSSYSSLDDVLTQVKNLEYRTPVGNVIIVDSGKYGQDEVADQAIRESFGEDVNQETAYYIHARIVQTGTDNPSWVDNNVNQSLITLISYESRMSDGISTLLADFRPMYVDDDGRWSIASTGIENGQTRDIYYIASLDGMDLSNGDLTIAIGPNDEIGLTYYVYSMTYGNIQGLAPEDLNPIESAAVETVAETTVAATTDTSETIVETTETTAPEA